MSERNRNILGSHRAQDVLICKLCTQYLRDPRQLPCGHSFCLLCLERYYRSECQRSESGRRRSPSVERRRRGLLPCPAAPVCLHVCIVPDEGVSAFPVNQKIADIKEHVVNEMAYNISRRMGRPHMTRGAETDTASVRSDETDFSDISCETTSSAPATGSSDSPDSKSPYPNLAKYAKYFEAEKDDGFGASGKYRSGMRSERRRVAMSSSFQHRRRRVHTPSPAAFDDSTTMRDVWSHQPSRCGSAPHLDSDSTTYRPMLRPRQGSSMVSSPLLRRAARPTSCIVEELADEHDYELLNHIGESSRLSETPCRATSTEQHPHRVLPTHRENISIRDDEKSMPTHDETAGHGRHFVEEIETGSSFGKTGKDEPPSHSKHLSDRLEISKNSGSTIPARDEPVRHGKHQSENSSSCNSNNTGISKAPGVPGVQSQPHSETDSTASNDVPICSEPNSCEKHYLDTGTTSTSTHADAAGNSKSHADDIKTGKSSTSASSRPGHRVLPNIPTDCGSMKTTSEPAHDTRGHGIHPETTTSTSDVRRARKLPTVPSVASKEHSQVQKDHGVLKSSVTEKQKSSTASLSGLNKSRLSDKENQKTADSRPLSNVYSSRPANVKSSSSDSVQTKQSASAKLHNVDHSTSSVTGNKSSSRESSVSQKSQDTGKSKADHTTSYSKSASSSKALGAERVKTLQTAPDKRGSGASKSTHKDDPSRASQEQKARKSECSSADKSRSTKSTPCSGNGSGSRLTYKVNAATIQPVLMNSKKKQNSPPKTKTNEYANASTQETVLSEDTDTEEQSTDVTVTTSAEDGINTKQPSPTPVGSSVSPPNSCNESDPKRRLSEVDKDNDHNLGSSLSFSSQALKTDLNSKTEDISGTSQYQSHTSGHLSRQLSSITDDEAPVTANAGNNKDARNNKKTQQWNDFMAILHAARSKYSSTDNRLPVSQTSRPVPVLGDGIIPCWQIQRDDFAVPSSIAIADDGSAVIADVSNSLIDFADTEGNIVHSVTGTKPFSVAIGSDGSIYVGDRRSRTVRVFDMYGSDVAQWDSEMTSFGWISGIAVLRNGQLAIVDRERCKVGIYTTTGERITEFGSYGVKNGQLCMADFVAVDSHDRIIVSDSGNHQLKLFDPTTGKLVATFAGRGNADGCLLWPKGLTVDVADRIIVADGGNDRICQFADDGRFIQNLVSGAARPYHVNCGGGGRLLGVTHFALSNASQVDVFTLGSVS